MQEYPKMISGESIMKLWRVDAARIFDLFPTGGLQPYKRTGREFRPPAEYHSYSLKMKEHASLLHRWNEIRGEIEFLKNHAKVLNDKLLLEQSRYQEENGKIFRQAITSIWEQAHRIKMEDPELRLWKHFEKDAVDDDKLEQLIDQVGNCQFEVDQVLKCFSIEDLDGESRKKVLAGFEAIPGSTGCKPADSQDIKASSPLFSFYEDGDGWAIGPFGMENHFRSMKGYDFIHFLLQHPNKKIASNIVQSLGKFEAAIGDFDPDEISSFKIISGPTGYVEPERLLDKQTIEIVRKALDKFKDERNNSDDLEEREQLDVKIEKCEMYLKDSNRKIYSKEDENARKIVQKNIRECTDKLSKHFGKSAPSLIQELKHISTGHTCLYDGQAEWKLHNRP